MRIQGQILFLFRHLFCFSLAVYLPLTRSLTRTSLLKSNPNWYHPNQIHPRQTNVPIGSAFQPKSQWTTSFCKAIAAICRFLPGRPYFRLVNSVFWRLLQLCVPVSCLEFKFLGFPPLSEPCSEVHSESGGGFRVHASLWFIRQISKQREILKLFFGFGSVCFGLSCCYLGDTPSGFLRPCSIVVKAGTHKPKTERIIFN